MAKTIRPLTKKPITARIDTEYFSGTDYMHLFELPRDDEATHYGSGGALEYGSVLPAAWGGVATSKAEDPRLQSRVRQTKKDGSEGLVEVHWVSIDVE